MLVLLLLLSYHEGSAHAATVDLCAASAGGGAGPHATDGDRYEAVGCTLSASIVTVGAAGGHLRDATLRLDGATVPNGAIAVLGDTTNVSIEIVGGSRVAVAGAAADVSALSFRDGEHRGLRVVVRDSTLSAENTQADGRSHAILFDSAPMLRSSALRLDNATLSAAGLGLSACVMRTRSAVVDSAMAVSGGVWEARSSSVAAYGAISTGLSGWSNSTLLVTGTTVRSTGSRARLFQWDTSSPTSHCRLRFERVSAVASAGGGVAVALVWQAASPVNDSVITVLGGSWASNSSGFATNILITVPVTNSTFLVDGAVFVATGDYAYNLRTESGAVLTNTTVGFVNNVSMTAASSTSTAATLSFKETSVEASSVIVEGGSLQATSAASVADIFASFGALWLRSSLTLHNAHLSAVAAKAASICNWNDAPLNHSFVSLVGVQASAMSQTSSALCLWWSTGAV